MQEKTKNIVVVIVFIMFLSIVFISNIIKKDENISISERRKLASFPKITTTSLFNGNTAKDFDNYTVDQFILRDKIREIKANYSMYVLNKKDNNKLFVKDNSIYKMEYPLNEKAIEKSSLKINQIYDKYLKGMNVYYSIIPGKNYYLEDDHLKMDYSKIESIMKSNLKDLKYIDIKDELDVNDFYNTDLHWKQENIIKIKARIQNEMLLDSINTNYINKKIGSFYGSYYGQIVSKVEPDNLNYLTNDMIENCTTYNFETKKEGTVYDLGKYKTSMDKYDIFLSGPVSIISIENPTVTDGKELLLFRDSFGSSLAPLLLESYSKITLIDIRYINSQILDQFIEFNNQDVLFIYSGVVLNQNIFK